MFIEAFVFSFQFALVLFACPKILFSSRIPESYQASYFIDDSDFNNDTTCYIRTFYAFSTLLFLSSLSFDSVC